MNLKRALAYAWLLAAPVCLSQEKTIEEPQGVEFADPFIMLDGDTYYAYGTMSDEGIEVYTSSDLVNWSPAGMALSKNIAVR